MRYGVTTVMGDVTTRYWLHSSRRRKPPGGPVLPLSITVIVLVIILIAVMADRDDDEPPLITPTATPTLPSPSPSVTPSPTATKGPMKEESGWIDAVVVIPTPTWPVVEPVPTREPRPTPSISQCADYRWTTMQVFTPSAQVKVDIRVDNRCPYDLGPANLLFEITGWRDGGRVQSVRGVPFETIRRGRSGELSIGLPGSEDWYHEIEVVVFD